MNDLMKIEIHEIDASSRMRSIDPKQVESIKASILDVGLINPITVCRTDGGYRLVAGGHRLEALRAVGYDQIPAHVVELTDLEMTIAECDENLCGTRLTPAEQSMFLARRKEAYEAIHGRAKAIGGQASALAQGKEVATDKLAVAFTSDTAARTGLSERDVRRKAERGEKVIPEVMQMVAGTRLDTGAYLDRIKDLSPSEQLTAAKRDLAQSTSVPQPKAEQPPPPPVIFDRFVGLVDQIEALPVPEIIGATPQRQRAVLSQRASGLAHRMDEIMEALEQ